MSKGFNLTAELNLRGPNNLRAVVSTIRKQVGSITANITPTINRSNIRTMVSDIRSQIGGVSVPINVTINRTSIQKISRDINSRLSGISIPVSIRVNRSSLSTARRDINRQLGNVNANVNITVSPTATRNAAGLTRNLTVLNQTLNQTTASATNAAAAIQSFAAAMRGAAGTNIPRNINIGLNTTGTNATNAANNVRQLGGEIENFGRQAGLAIRRFAAFTTVTSLFYGLASSIRSGISEFLSFDQALVKVSQVTGDSIGNMGKLSSTVTTLAKTYGVSSQELAGVSLTLAQAGLTAKETEGALKALALSSLAPSFDDMNSTVEGSIALMRQFGIGTNQLESALGSINSVAAKFAVEASDIIAAIQRTGGVFAAASRGVSEGTDALNEFVAVFTSIRATTRESAETIATGLRTIFTRIQRGQTIEALKQFGVNLTDVEGKFVGAYKAVELLSSGLSTLDPRDLRFSKIVEELGGFRQIGKVIPLIQEFATAQEALKIAQSGSGSLAEDAATGQLALAVQISKVREEFLGLIRSIGDTSSFRTLVKLGLDLASSLIQVADAAKELLPLIGIFAAIKGAQALTRFGAGFVGGVRGGTPAPTRGFASGGYVPGVGNSDTVSAMLTPGEFVIRKKAVKTIGVNRLAKLNRNAGGSVPTQYFENGGNVQSFDIGGEAKKSGIDWKNLYKGRGKKGPKGPRARFDLPQPGDKGFAEWQRQIYADYDADPSIPTIKVNGIPMPPEIAYVHKLIGEEVFRQNFGSSRRKKPGKLKKTPLGLIISAAKMSRGPRAPAGEMEKIMAGYQGSTEFQKETSGAGSSLFSTLKGPLSSFKRGGTFGGVITPGSENAAKIKGSLEKLLSQSSGQDAVKAKTALDKFDHFIAGGSPEKPGHVSHFTWAMNQIFKKGVATFGRGGSASRKMGVFDFDMTTGISKQKETPSLSGFRDPKLAVPDILGSSPTGLVDLMRKYGASQILTARSGGPKGEMRTALGTFFKKNGVILPSSRITTLGDQVGSLSTAEKKARALHGMVKKYGRLDFYDDDQANIDAAKMVRGVDARKVAIRKNSGGIVQKFAQKTPTSNSGLVEPLPSLEQKLLDDLKTRFGADNVSLSAKGITIKNSSFEGLSRATKVSGLGSEIVVPFRELGKKNFVPFKKRRGTGYSTVQEQLISSISSSRDQYIQQREISTLESKMAAFAEQKALEERVRKTGKRGVVVGLRGDTKEIADRSFFTSTPDATIKLNNKTKKRVSGVETEIVRGALPSNVATIISKDIKETIRLLVGRVGKAISEEAKVTGQKGYRSIGGVVKKQMAQFEGLAFESGLAIANLNAGGRYRPTWKSMDFAMGLEKEIADVFGVPANVAADATRQATQETARKKVQSGQITRGLGPGGEVARIKQNIATKVARKSRVSARIGKKVQKQASGGEIKGISAKSARDAILGKQLSGAEMIRAARRAGYDIEELDNRMVQLSRNNKIMHTLDRAKASELLGSMSTGYNLGGSIQKFANGGSPGDTVPALLTPGEFVINKKAAKRLGSSKLNRLNRADRISGFNSGGPVGNIQSYSSGGDVQRFFFGGGARARPGTQANSQNLAISGNVITQLMEITNALGELGVASSASADLIRRGGRISVQASTAAYEADILRMRVAGAPMQTVIEAETRLANMRQQAQTQIRAQRQLSGVGGAQLENIDATARQRLQQLVSRRQASGLEVDETFMQRAENVSYSRAARQQGLAPTQTAGLSGNDLRQYISSAMGDPRTFEQMNRQFEARRRHELNNQYVAENRFGGDRRRILNQASADAAEEARIRRQTLNQTRGASGPGAAGGQRMQQAMFGASFALPMIAQMLSGDPSQATTASGAATSAGIQGGANTFAMGTMIASMMPPGLGQGLALVATGAAAVGKAFIDARNATIEFEKNLAAKKIEMALEDTSRLFDKLAKDVKDIDVQNAIGQKMIEASVAAQKSIEMQSTTAKAFFVNMFDAFGGGSIKEKSEASQRSQILEKFGTSAYLETTNIGQRFMGGEGSAQNRATDARNSYISQMIPEQSRDISKQFAPIAESSIKLIEEKIRAGLNIEDYINTDEFKKLSTAIALSNRAVSEQVLKIRNSTSLTDAQKVAQERLIISVAAEEETRKRASIAAREIQLREIQKATNQFSRSLERMFQNMEQAINKTNFGLENMARDLDLVSSSLSGQAKAGEGTIKALNVLQNPRAYGAGEVNTARSQAAGFFDGSSDIVRGLLILGDDIEATIMSTINRTVKEADGDSPAKIAIAIEKSVNDKLQSLELPADISEKLAREVKVALNEIRKEGDEKADFTQIEEKLKDLGRILESTRRAQEVSLKVLENWQSSLNSYTSSINSLTDLQVDFQARLRKSSELLIDSQNNLAKTLGKDISIENLIGNRNAIIKQQTGGVSEPSDIFKNINKLETQRRQQEGAVDIARQGGPNRLKDFTTMSNNLNLTNLALRENYDALKNLAENSDIAAASLNKIQEAQQKQQGRVGFIEKLVTSTPEEFESLNRAFVRLQNNANGQINTINNSVGAQKAYIEAIRGGATAFEAMRAAQTAFSNERRDTLSSLNDILPFLGNGQQVNQIRANTLESMLAESGMGVSPMFQDVLNALRNPELDPETQRAIALYQEANQLQIAANGFLNNINNKLQEETSEKAAKAIADALVNTVLTFKNAEQADLNRGVIPQNKAAGGIIYASNGGFAPKGTDTVPAMLTPGEFVVNRNATATNLPLLKSINSQKFSGGGKVKYYAGGGLVSSYLNNDSDTLQKFQQSSEKFIDPSDPAISSLLNSGKLTQKLQLLPNIWHRAPSVNDLQTPKRDAVLTRDRNNPTVVSRYVPDLYPSEGDIVPGFVNRKVYFSNGLETKNLSISAGRSQLSSTIPGTNKKIIFGIDGDRTINLATKNIKKADFKQYKEDMSNIKGNFDSISWINDPTSQIARVLVSNMASEGYPTDITPLEKSGGSLNPNAKEKNNVLYYGNPLNSEIKDYGKLWSLTDSGVIINALTIGDPTHKPEYDNIPEEGQIKLVRNGNIQSTRTKGITKNSPGIIKPKEIRDIASYHKKQFNIINQGVKLADDNFKDVKFIDSADTKQYQDLQSKFTNLYYNTSAYEDFNNHLSRFDNSALKDASSLIVASDTAISREDISKYIENQQAQLAPGTKPMNNGNPITVGLSSPLKGDLGNLTKDWVKKGEFDIFSEDAGDVKRFPFLVNADFADLGKGFEKRAQIEALEKKNKISQKIVTDNNKLNLIVGLNKKIDVPYSATYTKYNGPMWNTTTNSFDEDPKNQLEVFLPEDKNIFGGLDITNQRLYNNKKIFDINSFAGSSIPADPASNLIDLVRNNGDQNLIDQAKNEIEKNSNLTFPHKRPDAGSLIKFNNPTGQQIFSGYSQQPSTTFNFGEFLSQAIVDYAKKTKEQAGIVTGKVADQKMGQDVIGDQPMESVRVLQQLTQGALSIFGRRPIPGLPKGWLANNISSLQGILPRGARTSVGRLANNDQAKAAAGIIRNVINNAGAYVSNIAGKTNNPQLYNGLKDTYGLMSGAYKAFDSISKSDTRNLAQLLGNNMLVQGQGSGIVENPVENLFRILGASASFEKAAASSLSEDYKATLGNQLVGSKITTVGADGSIKLVDPKDAPPPQVNNYSDLMNLGLNPYNEFSSRTVRSSIFDKLITDISSAVDNRGMPYFEPNTSNFLTSSLDYLKQWYGGAGAWLGQDYLFDKAANPDPANRGQQFVQNLDAGKGLYDIANMAHRNLGGSVKYGDLPGDVWLKNRVEAGNFATGGMVYASNGQMINFQPRGTDTVPAMLTPGEFVVNRSATQKNLPLLKSINSNAYMAEGGLLEQPKVVQGVTIPGRDNLSPRINRIDKNIGLNTSDISGIQKTMVSIKDEIKQLSSDQKMLTGPLKDLQNQILVIADMVMKGPQAIYDQVLTTLRQLWDSMGPMFDPIALPNGWPAAPFNKGGPVYASNGQLINFQPKGTDTVPAMLTPGEFVVNRSATQKNLPLLKSINSGVGGYSSGGVVYLQDGGLTPETRKSLSDLQAQGYNLEDVVSGKTRVIGINVKPIQVEDPLLPTRPAPNKEEYDRNPKIWNGYQDNAGRLWRQRGVTYLSRHGEPLSMPNSQERWQAFESVVSAFAGAGGVKTGRGLADVRQLPAGMPMQRTAPGPLGSRVDIPSAIGRPNPGNVATKQQIVLDAIKDSGGNFYISDIQSGELAVKPIGTTIGTKTKFPQDIRSQAFFDSLNSKQFTRYEERFEDPRSGTPKDSFAKAIESKISMMMSMRKTGQSDYIDRLIKDAELTSEYTDRDIATGSLLAEDYPSGLSYPGATPEQKIGNYTAQQIKDYRYTALQQVMRNSGSANAEKIVEFLRVENASAANNDSGSEYERVLRSLGDTEAQRRRWYFPANEAFSPGSLRTYMEMRAGEGLYKEKAGENIDFSEMSNMQIRRLVLPESVAKRYRVDQLQYLRDLKGEYLYDTVIARDGYEFKKYKNLDELAGQSLNPKEEFLFPARIGNEFNEVVSPEVLLTDMQMALKSRSLAGAMSQYRRKLGRALTTEEMPVAFEAIEKEAIERKRLLEEYAKEYIKQSANKSSEGVGRRSTSSTPPTPPKRGPIPLSELNNVAAKKADVDAAHGSGSGMISVDPNKLTQGMLGEGFYVGLKAEEAPITYLRMGIDRWLNANNLRKNNITPEQFSEFPGGIYPVKISGGIDDFVAADQVLKENPSVLAKVSRIYGDLKLKKTSLGPIKYVNDPITGRPKVSRSESPFDIESATMMEIYNNIQNQLAAKHEASFAGRTDIPDARGEALRLSATEMRKIFVEYGIPGITDLKNSASQGAMAAIFDFDRISLGKAYIPDEVLKEVLGYDDIAEAKRQIEFIRSGKFPETETAITKNRGGMIYASQGQLINFQPKGTDTVPAMLTPGEFVVNRAATQKNLPLLQSINSGISTGTYSDGGVVYLKAGGRPADRNETDAYKRGGLKDKLRDQSSSRFQIQKQGAQNHRQGRLWVFTVPKDAMIKDDQGKPLNNGLQFLLKDANNNPTNNLTTESLAAMDISKVFSLRSNSSTNAQKTIQDIDNGRNARVEGSLPIDAIRAIDQTKKQQAQKSFDQKILDELSYQIQMNKDIFSVFNAEFFNTDPGVIDKYTKEMNEVINNIDLNNPMSVMAGMAALGPKVNKVKTRRDHLQEIIRNNQQAVAVLRAADNPNDPANKREAFGNFTPLQIHDAQIAKGNKELTSADKILENLMNNPKVQMGVQNPLVAQAFQRLLIPTRGFGVPISTFEGGAGAVAIPQKLARGGLVYAEDGMEIPSRPQLPYKEKTGSLPLSPRDLYLQQTRETKSGNFDPTKASPPTRLKPLEAKQQLDNLITDFETYGYSNIKDIPSFQLPAEKKYLQDTIDLFNNLPQKELMPKGSALTGPNDPRYRNFYSDTIKRIKEIEEKMKPESNGAIGYSKGGTIYANKGKLINFQPRGTDTVPAMLTPGEFVVNKKSTENNLPLLQSINRGGGGRVSYLAAGTPGTEELYRSLANFSQILNTGAESIRKVLDTIASKLDESSNRSQNITQTNNGVSNNSNSAAIVDALGNRLDRFIEQLQNALPPFIRVEGQHQVNVVINGGAILQQLLSGPIGNIVQGAIQSAFNKQSRKNEGV